MTEVKFYPLSETFPLKLQYTVIGAFLDGKPVWCRHRDRDTWEMPGGHIEPAEGALDAALRELHEETGAGTFTIKPVCFYSVSRGGTETAGLLSRAEIETPGELKHEIAELYIGENPPGEWTYPDIQPKLMERLK